MPPEINTLSVKDMFLQADPTVQGVMILLFLASIFCWVVIFEKIFILRRLARSVRLFRRTAARSSDDFSPEIFTGFARGLVEAGLAESLDGAGRESRADFRERAERAMRGVLNGRLDRAGARVAFLATVGAASPFVGLFGTVWGIMHSFIGIAATGETTLAVVAPGIAEALLATAMGLAAAIPAVVAYNKIAGVLKKIAKEALAGIGLVGNNLARLHFTLLEEQGDS